MWRQPNVVRGRQWVKKKRISWRAFAACTDTKTPHKLSDQSALHVAWTSESLLLNINNLLGLFDEVIIALLYKLNYVVDSSHKPLAAMMAPSICGRRTKRARVAMPTTIPARWRATVAARKPSAYASASIAPGISNPWA